MELKADRKVDIIERFFDKIEIDGVCSFFVDKDDEDNIQIILVIDRDYLDDQQNLENSVIINNIKLNIYEKLRNYLGFTGIYVGNIVKRC